MSESKDIPVLTDLIESAPAITLSDLGLENDPAVGAKQVKQVDDGTAGLAQGIPVSSGTIDTPDIELGPFEHDHIDVNPALEQTVRRILDEHMELAWQEIKLAIQQHRDQS